MKCFRSVAILGLAVIALNVLLGCEPEAKSVPLADAKQHAKEKDERDGHYSFQKGGK